MSYPTICTFQFLLAVSQANLVVNFRNRCSIHASKVEKVADNAACFCCSKGRQWLKDIIALLVFLSGIERYWRYMKLNLMQSIIEGFPILPCLIADHEVNVSGLFVRLLRMELLNFDNLLVVLVSFNVLEETQIVVWIVEIVYTHIYSYNYVRFTTSPALA